MSDKEKNTDDLIGQLCDDLKPVKPCCPYRNIYIWLIFSAAYLTGVITFYGPQVDFSEKITDAAFLFEMGTALAILITGAMASSWLSFPDSAQKEWIKYVAVALFGSLMLWIFANMIEEGMDLALFKLGSCSKGLLVEVIPFVALILMTIRGHSTQPYWLMTMNIFAVTALGWMGLRLTCAMYDSMVYSFANYFLPFAILSVAVGFFARKLFKW